MTGYGFFNSLRFIALLVIFEGGSLLVLGILIRSELATEARFRATYGANWQAKYEESYGSLAAAHAKVVAGSVGIVVISALMVWLYKLLRPNRHAGT